MIDEIQDACKRTEDILTQGFAEAGQEMFGDFLMQAEKNIAAELHIERKEDEFND